ncbi:C2H2-like zinc finger protein [Abeliophyllum distichum]|uniref:C2H2-like zinc finger protein n=1 Tax=Abeliophyllum distichum TaxID=126358 RepID=A0ABD1U2S3_9LAMI
MEEDQELRFVCKLCNKRYPCGKSLGGHMRSHVIANSAESEEKVEANMRRISSLGGTGKIIIHESRVVEFANGQSSYGLRENPKKTWRAVDSTFPLPQEKVCKQCGKGFQSLKALCGHMACHSERERGLKDDHSWTSENQKLVMDSHSDTESEDRMLRTRLSKSKRFKKIIVKSSSFSLANNGSSSVSEIDEQEQEEVAMCLMMLSRDSGTKGGVNSNVESSDNNSVVLETKSSSIDMRIGIKECLNYVNNRDETLQMKKIGDRKLKGRALDAEIAQIEKSDSGYFLDECAKVESDGSVDGYHRNGAFGEWKKPPMGVGARGEELVSEFKESLNRIKSNKTELRKEVARENGYDDAGRVSNSARIDSRKIKHRFEVPELWNESGKKMKNSSSDDQECDNIQKRSKYECLNCKKTFNSYQALGGHRPCHKKSNPFSEAQYEMGENSLDDTNDFRSAHKLGQSTSKKKPISKNSSHDLKKGNKSKKNKVHVCPFCDRVFKNGQALGGHKRSHFIGGHEETSSRTPVNKPELPDLLDLNLPAPEEDEDDGHGQFFPW